MAFSFADLPLIKCSVLLEIAGMAFGVSKFFNVKFLVLFHPTYGVYRVLFFLCVHKQDEHCKRVGRLCAAGRCRSVLL